jgi:ligand-binding sensor domain-containing protein
MPKILKFHKISLLIFFVNVISYNFYSQTEPIFQKIDQSKGLSSSKITGIVKEENGFIWISTQNGLNRYDGRSWFFK